MDERTEAAPANRGRDSVAATDSGDGADARQILLEEARTAANQQLGQVRKIDAEAVRTVRISLLLAGILAGGSQLPPFPDVGIFGALGMWSLVGSLLAGLYVYGTMHLFVGSGPGELGVDYEESPSVERAHVEVIGKYEDGIRRNWKTLYANGIVLVVARCLLAAAAVFLVLGFVQSTTLGG